jgi:hypothetical protein
MDVNQLLAVVPVSDIEAPARWYERLLGGPPTNHPMPSLVEWRTTSTGWARVFADRARAGHTALNLAVDDLEAASPSSWVADWLRGTSRPRTKACGSQRSPIRMATRSR